MQQPRRYLASRVRDHVRRRFAQTVVCLPSLIVTAVSAAGEPPATETPRSANVGAENADSKKKAKEHFATGLKFYEDGDFALALIEFERAYSYVPDYRVLFNIGQVSIQLARYAHASQALQQYLTSGGNQLPKARIADVQKDLAMLENRTARLSVKCNVDGADVYLDDALLGKTPITEAILVDAGEHRVLVQMPGYQSRTEPLTLAGRDESSVQFELTEEQRPIRLVPEIPATIPPQSASPSTPTVPALVPPPRRNELLYVGWGATGVLTLGWAISGYIGLKAASDFNTAMQHTSTKSQLESLSTKARGWLLAADIVGAATIITGGTTLYFTLRQPSREGPVTQTHSSSVKVGFGAGAAQISATF
jgi:hypothetical protein